MEKQPTLGLINNKNGYSGTDLTKIAKSTYGNSDKITTEQLANLMDNLVPSNYLLKHHYVNNGKQRFIFNVPNRDKSKWLSHRPWQKQIVDDQYKDKVIIKSRQLGLSEIGVASMLQWADTHSYAGVKCL